MAFQGSLSPSTVVDDSSVGTVTWTNPSNAVASDNVRASINGATGATSHYLKATGFGFSIPTGATIDGIVLEIERAKGALDAAAKDSSVKLVKGGTVSGTDKADTVTVWPSGDAYATYGSPTDLWGQSWTPSDINDSTFGAALSAQITFADFGSDAVVDHMRITVYYSTSGNATFNASVLSVVASIATAAIVTSSILSPAVQSAAFSLPSSAVSIGQVNAGSPVGLLMGITRADTGVNITPNVLVLTSSLPPPSVPQNVTVSPSVQALTFSLPASLAEAIVEFDPNPLTATFSTQSPTVVTTSNVVVTPSVLSPVFSTPDPTIRTAQIISVNVLSAALSTQAPTVKYGVTVSPSVLSASFSVQTPIPGIGVNISPSVQALALSLPTRIVAIGINISPLVQSLQFSSQSPSFILDYTVFPNPVTSLFSTPSPTRSGGFYTSKYQTRDTNYEAKYASQGTDYEDKYSTRGTSYDDKYTKLNL
jgi:hypothetical protein